MTVWLAAALLAIGYLLGQVWPLPEDRHADVDELVARRRDRARAGTRDV